MARVLVTGASGFIGSHIARALSTAGHEVLATGRDATRLAAFASTPIAVDTADITTDPLEKLVIGRDAVVHCAALSSPWGARSAFQQANVHATERLLDAANHAGVGRFVHLSSPSIYFRMADQFDIPETFAPPQALDQRIRGNEMAIRTMRGRGTVRLHVAHHPAPARGIW